MKEKILSLLQSRFAGVRKDGLNHIATILSFQVNTEKDAETLAGNITVEQVNSFIADWRKEVDAEITRANKTHEDGLRKKYDLTEKQPEPANPPPPVDVDPATGVDAATIQKLIADSIATATQPLLEQMNTFKAGETAKSRLQALNDKLKDCKDETFKTKVLKDFARMTFDTADAFNEYLTDTETDVKTANQKASLSEMGVLGRPSTPGPGGTEPSEADLNAILERMPI
jgi:hypothetical protein